MRSVLLAAAVVWAAACAPTSGLQFEIDASADPAATEIMVYVGSGYGDTASIAGAGLSPETIHDGKFWPLTFDSADVVKLSGHHIATVSFVPGDGIEWITVVVVGLTDGVRTSVATKINAAVRGDVVEVWDMVLEPAGTDVKITTGRAVTWWGEELDQTTCVQAVDRSEPKASQNVFIGVPGDKDCDGLEDGKREECDDEWYHAAMRPSQDRLSCIEPHPVSDPLGVTSSVCMFGSRNCDDGMPDLRDDCSHLPAYCAPKGLCDECSKATPQKSYGCALDLDPIQTSTVPYVRCEFHIDTTFDPPRLCDETLSATPPSSWAPFQTTCGGPPLWHPPEPFKSWASTAEIGGVRVSFVAGNGSLTQCGIKVFASPVVGRTIDLGAFPEHGLVSIPLTNGRGVVAPFVFSLVEVSGCSSADRACVVSPVTTGETIQRCLQNAPT